MKTKINKHTASSLNFIKDKIHLINYRVQNGDFFEKLLHLFFKKIYQKNAQKIALDKFARINEIAKLMSDKNGKN